MNARLRCRGLVSVVVAAAGVATLASTAAAQASYTEPYPNVPVTVTWLPGYQAPGTPESLDKVGVVEVGSQSAKNVLVLEPGGSAGSGYWVPFARWVVSTLPGWQVWSVERRQNLLEDQSELDLAKEGKATAQQLYDYYLGWITDPSITNHFQFIPDSSVGYARQWGMSVAVHDLRAVIEAAKLRGGHVVLGGHSTGGAITSAYATWDFNGRAGADDLAGLVFDDGATAPTASLTGDQALQDLIAAQFASPWYSYGSVPTPFLGLLSATGSTGALIDPDEPAFGQSFAFLPSEIDPPLPVTNLGLFGYAVSNTTSPASLAAVQASVGQLAASGSPRGWDGTAALTPIQRYAEMLSGSGLEGIDGTEWYFPIRLVLDSEAVADGNENPAQLVLGLQSTLGSHLPRRLRMYAFGAALGGQSVLDDTVALARQSRIPMSHLMLINRQSTYTHNDPAAAYPDNDFFNGLVTFLGQFSGGDGP